MIPKSISEQLMFNTVRISTSTGRGTGSFFNFKVLNRIVPVIVTNKHVVNNKTKETVAFKVHLKDPQGGATENLEVTYTADWIFHPEVDLCFCYAASLFEEVKKRFNKEVFSIVNTEENIYSPEKLLDLNALEELVMVGYPIGLSDESHNYPIFRRGYTAAHPGVDFNQDGIGLIDMACLPGSSGSPVCILNETSYHDAKNHSVNFNPRFILLGFQFAIPVYNASGQLVIQPAPTANSVITTTTQIPTNLGYYVKAHKLLEMKPLIENALRNAGIE